MGVCYEEYSCWSDFFLPFRLNRDTAIAEIV